MIERLRDLIKAEDEFFEKRPGTREYGWDAYELNVTPAEAKRFVNDGITRIVYKSNKHTSYVFNRERINEIIESYNEINIMFPHENGIPSDLFDTIYGYEDIKKHLLNFIKNGTRGGFLFVGPPASAKSMFLMELGRLPGAHYVTASSSTKAGIRDIIMDEEPKYLLIDELDKANNRDFDSLLSLMETGIVQKNTHATSVQKILKTQVFAAANTDRFPPGVLSRFIRIALPAYSTSQLREVGEWILVKREKLRPDLAHLIVSCSMDLGAISDPRDFIKIARIRNGDTEEDIRDTVKFMLKYS